MLTVWLKFVLTVCFILFPVVSCDIIKLYPKPGKYETIQFGKCNSSNIHWSRNGTGQVLCSCAPSDCRSNVKRYTCQNKDLNIKFDPSEDTFVIKAECCQETKYYTFSEPIRVTEAFLQQNNQNITSTMIINSGEPVTLTCVTGTSRPTPIIDWYIGSRPIGSGTSLTFTPSNTDHNEVIFCQAYNTDPNLKVDSNKLRLIVRDLTGGSPSINPGVWILCIGIIIAIWMIGS